MSRYSGISKINIKVRDASVKIVVDHRLAQGSVEIKGRIAKRASGDLLSLDYESSRRSGPLTKATDWKWSSWRTATSSCMVVSDSGRTITLVVAPGVQYRTFKFK